METNKIQWRRIAKGEELPCDSLLMRYDGTISSVGSCAGVEVGQDAYYLPFDELKKLPKEESEDERIRKELIRFVKGYFPDETSEQRKAYLAWIDKQGEHKKFRDSIHIGDKVTRNEDGVLVNLSRFKRKAKKDEKQGEPVDINPSEFDLRLNKLLKQFESLPKEELASSLSFYLNVVQNDGSYKDEKQGEQKPVDKVEPTFEVGDWVVYCNDDVDLITGIEENGYSVNNGGYIPFVCASDMRPWTIEDAKDGDILATEPTEEFNSPFVAIYKKTNEGDFDSYCFIGFDGKFYKGEDGHSTEDIHPATKEQRDILFQKMHEAGYKWDAEKKDLKKIEQKPWSEDDEKNLNEALSYIKDETLKTFIKDRVQPQLQQEWSEEDLYMLKQAIRCVNNSGKLEVSTEEIEDWLKSLRPQTTWKPSDEQIDSLDIAHRKELLEQLKKPKG